MARNRTNYPSLGLFSSKNLTGLSSGQHAQFGRFQSFDTNTEISRTSLNQMGQQAAIQKIVTEEPTVGGNFSYYLTNGYQERALGFYVQDASSFTGQANFVSGQIVTTSGNCLHVPVSPEGVDLNLMAGGSAAYSGLPVYSFGNVYVTSYELSIGVGDIPTVSVGFEAANAITSTYTVNGAITGCVSPAVNPSNGQMLNTGFAVKFPAPTPYTGVGIPMALRPADATLSFGSLTGTASGVASPFVNLDVAGSDGIRIQSATLSVPLSRDPIRQIGSRFAYARPTTLPITATLSVNALVNEVVSRNLSAMLDDESTHDITLTIRNTNGTPNISYTLKGAQFDSSSSSLSIGDNQSCDLVFSADVGGVGDQSRGVFMSGQNIVNPFD
jgi:hypothetical protein